MARQPAFRASALTHLSSPEQLDTLVRVTRPRGWIALAAVGLVLAAAIVWSLVGTVQTTFTGPGVLLTPFGTTDGVAADDGRITRLLVSQGDAVAAGDELATVATASGESQPVIAPRSGEVVELLAFPDDHVDAGAPVVTIQPDDEDLRVFMYVPIDGIQPVKPGMPVQISVTTEPPELYGLLRGTVTRVGSFPATRAGVNALLNNPDIASIVVSGGPVVQVEVTLEPSPDTPSGYAWTSGVGPPTRLSAGTLVNASVVTAVQHPISFLLPSNRSPQ